METIKPQFDDQKTWQLLADGKTSGVFQVESQIYTQAINELGTTTNFDTLIDLMALMRPGCTDSKTDKLYIKRALGREPIQYEHPLLESILNKTKGIILYQEQCLQVANKLAGYSLAEADLFRKAISSKKEEMLEKERSKFIDGCIKTNSIPREIATSIFNQIVTFAGYAFNKSHSVCYGLISFWTAYLKANFPIEYMTSLLSSQSTEDDIRKYIREARDLNIKVGPPDINSSLSTFSIVGDDTILFGLSKIKGVGEGVADHIIRNRPYKDFLDFYKKVDRQIVDSRLVDTFIKAGCFRSTEKNLTTKQLLENTDKIKAIFKNKTWISPSKVALGTLETWKLQKKKSGEPLEYSQLELANSERETMGFYISTHPIQHLKKPDILNNPKYVELNRIDDAGKEFFTIGVLADKVRAKKSRRGIVFHELEIEDEKSLLNLPIFGNSHQEVLRELKPGDVIAIKMKKSKGRVYVDKIKKIETCLS